MRQFTKYLNSVVLAVSVCLGLFNSETPAQQQTNEILVISPEEAKVPIQGTVRFRAQLFGVSNFTALTADRIDWKVEPEDLGRITDDGFFIAGNKPGNGAIIATAILLNREVKARAKIVVGETDVEDRTKLELIVQPEKAALGFGDSLRFHAKLSYKNSDKVVPNLLVNWLVKPRHIGKINQRGLFVAGNDPVQGEVIAYIEYNGTRIFGGSQVVVGSRPNAAAAGRVTDENSGEGVENAEVVAYRIGHVRWSRRVLTDPDGNYLLEKLIPGKYVLWAKGKGYITEYFEEAQSFKDATPVQMAENDTANGINFTLNHGGVIAGTVYSNVNSLPLAHAHVSVFGRNSLDANLKHHSVTDENGNYIIDNLRTGDYLVVADKPGYQHEFFDNAVKPDEATAVHVEVPDTTNGIDFSLSMHGAISGRVIVDDSTNAPIKGAIVFARDLNNSRSDRDKKVRTNENGEYLLELDPGFYLIGVEAKDYNNEFFDDVFIPALATPVQVIENEHTGDINFALLPLSTMSGVVTDGNGSPIERASVFAYPEVGQGHSVKTETNENGEYLLTGLYAGIYFVKANARGFHPEFYLEAKRLSDATPVSVGINEQIGDIDFTLDAASAIEGIVVSEDEGNPPLARALIIAKLIGAPFQSKAFSNDDGSYRIDNLPAGSYYVYAMARGFHREFFDNAVTREEATVVDLDVAEVEAGIDFSLKPIPDHEGSISGLVTADLDSLPIPGAIVVAVGAQSGPPFFGVTSADGLYELKGLPNGDYYVMSWADGYIGEFFDDVHNWHKATLVNVVSPHESSSIDFALAKKRNGPYRVRGKVVTRQNQPIANALIYARSKRGIDGFAVSDEEGNYEINEMAAGQVQIIAAVPGLKQNNDNNLASDDSVTVDLNSGNDNYQANITMDGDVATGVDAIDGAIPETYGLDQNYPNPFNPETTIQIHLPVSGEVTLKVYNLLGQEIVTLANEILEAGNHVLNWNGLNKFQTQVPSGIYYYRIQVKNGKNVTFEQIRKMTLLK